MNTKKPIEARKRFFRLPGGNHLSPKFVESISVAENHSHWGVLVGMASGQTIWFDAIDCPAFEHENFWGETPRQQDPRRRAERLRDYLEDCLTEAMR